jgi:hypothetical protein
MNTLKQLQAIRKELKDAEKARDAKKYRFIFNAMDKLESLITEVRGLQRQAFPLPPHLRGGCFPHRSGEQRH